MASVWLVSTSDYDDFTLYGVCCSERAAEAFVDRLCDVERARNKAQQTRDREFYKTYGKSVMVRPATDRQVEAEVKRFRVSLVVEEWPLLSIETAKTWSEE